MIAKLVGTACMAGTALERSEDSLRINAVFIERLNRTLRRSLDYRA